MESTTEINSRLTGEKFRFRKCDGHMRKGIERKKNAERVKKWFENATEVTVFENIC